MTLLDELGEELEEEGDDEQTDVHAVNIGIGSHDDLVVTQGVQTFLDVEGCLQQVELLVLIDHLLGEAERVEGLAAQGEDGLRVDVAALGDASAGRVALGDEDARLFLLVVLDIGEMNATVAQLTIVQVSLLGTLAGQFRHTCHRLALALALLDLVLNDLSHILVDMQVVVHLLLDEVAHIFINSVTIGSHHGRAQLDLGLTLEDGFLDVDGYGGHDARTDVAILVFAKELLDGLGNMLLEGTLVGSSLGGVLAVDEGVVFLAILVGMGEGYLDIVAFEVDNGIEGVIGHAVFQQVLQSVTRENAPPVVHDGKSGIQIGVVAQHVLHNVVMKPIVLEELGIVVGLEVDIGTAFVVRLFRHVT